MTDFGDLAFHVQYGLKEVACTEAGCELAHESHVVHRVPTGEATLTLAGPAQLIREAAAAVFPDLAKVFDPPKVVVEHCGACPTPNAPSLRFHPDGDAYHREDGATPVHLSHDWAWRDPDHAWCRKCCSDVKHDDATTPVGAKPCKPVDRERRSAFHFCVACGASSQHVPVDQVSGKCSECVADGWEPVAVKPLDKSSDGD